MNGLILKPKISEKSYFLSNQGIFVFDVPMTANKQLVADAVSEQFNVTVTTVRTSVVKGKVKKSPRRRQQPVDGRRTDTKRAYVSLKKGETIQLFEDGQE